MNVPQNSMALDDIRVLDLAGPTGVYCTKILADLGADVIKVEPPGGDPARKIGPFYHDEIDPEKSLHFFHFNTNKRGVTLDLETETGRGVFKVLVKTADIMVETFAPGYLSSIGLGYEALKEINPGLILVSITWFGQTGPYRDFKGSDLIVQAMTGMMYTIGFPEDPPTGVGASQTHHMASNHAAMGALMALCNRDLTGQGQWIDLAVEGCCMRMADMVALMYWIEGTVRKRSGFEYYRGLQDVWACKDGYIICSALGGGGADVILEWMDSEGLAADLLDPEYEDVIAAIKGVSGGARGGSGKKKKGAPSLKDLQTARKHVEEVWQAFLMNHTKKELFNGAQLRRVVLMPVNTAQDIAEDDGLRERGYFVEVEHPELGDSLKYPGPPYRLSETPWSMRRRAPLIGEHNFEIYGELGFSKERIGELAASKVI